MNKKTKKIVAIAALTTAPLLLVGTTLPFVLPKSTSTNEGVQGSDFVNLPSLDRSGMDSLLNAAQEQKSKYENPSSGTTAQRGVVTLNPLTSSYKVEDFREWKSMKDSLATQVENAKNDEIERLLLLIAYFKGTAISVANLPSLELSLEVNDQTHMELVVTSKNGLELNQEGNTRVSVKFSLINLNVSPKASVGEVPSFQDIYAYARSLNNGVSSTSMDGKLAIIGIYFEGEMLTVENMDKLTMVAEVINSGNALKVTLKAYQGYTFGTNKVTSISIIVNKAKDLTILNVTPKTKLPTIPASQNLESEKARLDGIFNGSDINAKISELKRFFDGDITSHEVNSLTVYTQIVNGGGIDVTLRTHEGYTFGSQLTSIKVFLKQEDDVILKIGSRANPPLLSASTSLESEKARLDKLFAGSDNNAKLREMLRFFEGSSLNLENVNNVTMEVKIINGERIQLLMYTKPGYVFGWAHLTVIRANLNYEKVLIDVTASPYTPVVTTTNMRALTSGTNFTNLPYPKNNNAFLNEMFNNLGESKLTNLMKFTLYNLKSDGTLGSAVTSTPQVGRNYVIQINVPHPYEFKTPSGALSNTLNSQAFTLKNGIEGLSEKYGGLTYLNLVDFYQGNSQYIKFDSYGKIYWPSRTNSRYVIEGLFTGLYQGTYNNFALKMYEIYDNGALKTLIKHPRDINPMKEYVFTIEANNGYAFTRTDGSSTTSMQSRHVKPKHYLDIKSPYSSSSYNSSVDTLYRLFNRYGVFNQGVTAPDFGAGRALLNALFPVIKNNKHVRTNVTFELREVLPSGSTVRATSVRSGTKYRIAIRSNDGYALYSDTHGGPTLSMNSVVINV